MQTEICPTVKVGEASPSYRRHFTWEEHHGATICQIKDGKDSVEVIVETPPRGDSESLKLHYNPCSRCEGMPGILPEGDKPNP